MNECLELLERNESLHDKSKRPWQMRDGNNRLCHGICRVIKRSSDAQQLAVIRHLGVLRRNVYVGGHRHRILDVNDRRRGTRAKGSWIERGDQVHQHLAHRLQCIPRQRCVCPVRCGGRPLSLQSKLPAGDAGKMVRAGMQFVYDHQLAPVGCELVVTNLVLPLGTRIDGLFWDQLNRHPVLVSWKTCSKERPEDLIQLTVELQMLARTHQVHCRAAHIIYLRVYGRDPDCLVHAVTLDERACARAQEVLIA